MLSGIAALCAALAWPVTLVLVVLVFRREITEVPKALAQLGIRKISLGGFSMEFVETDATAGTSLDKATFGVREAPAAGNLMSYRHSILEAMRVPTTIDAVVINVGSNPGWLSSRLFFFAELMERMRGVRCFVFVETIGGTRPRFLGTAAPRKVRYALGSRSPWLEEALAYAYASLGEPEPGVTPTGSPEQAYQIYSLTGALGPEQAARLIEPYLTRIQAPPAPPPFNPADWTQLQGSNTWEHGTFLQPADLNTLLGDDLNQSAVIAGVAASQETKVRSVLGKKGEFVAFVDSDMRFERLVDRRQLIEEAAHWLAQVA